MHACIKLGFSSYDPIEVKGAKVAPRDVLLSLVRRPVNNFLTEDESTVVTPPEYIWSMVMEIEGEKAGDKIKYTLTQGSTEDSADEKLKMFRRLGTTMIFVAAPMIAVAKISIEGDAGRGLIAHECFDPVKFLKMMADMGVPVKFHETVSKSVSIC